MDVAVKHIKAINKIGIIYSLVRVIKVSNVIILISLERGINLIYSKIGIGVVILKSLFYYFLVQEDIL